MIKDIIIVTLLWAASRYYWDIDLMQYYSVLDSITTEQDIIILFGGTLFAIFLVICSYALRGLSCFALMKFFNRLFLEAGQFTVSVIAFAAIVFLIQTKTNVWGDLGLIAVVPFEIVIACFYGLWLYDFNYPIFSDMADFFIFPALSGIGVIAMIFLS